MHENATLFRLHATQRAAAYWLNSTRFHPLDNVLMYGLQVTPLLLLGVSVLAGFTVWSLVHGFFQHANIDVRLGPLNYLFSMAELHRWHQPRYPRGGPTTEVIASCGISCLGRSFYLRSGAHRSQ